MPLRRPRLYFRRAIFAHKPRDEQARYGCLSECAIFPDGIEVLLGSSAKRVKSADYGTIRLVVGTPDGEHILTGSHLLVAVGRTPNTEILNLEVAGVEQNERGFVTVSK